MIKTTITPSERNGKPSHALLGMVAGIVHKELHAPRLSQAFADFPPALKRWILEPKRTRP
jgi:hypothetical protein